MRPPPAPVMLRAALALCLASLLVGAVAGGLLRAGVALPPAGDWPGRAALAHAFLMMSGFIGSVIGIERAVAVKLRWAFAAPLASALAGVLMLAGHAGVAAALSVLAAAVFVAVNAVVVRRQPAAHTRLLLVGALAWLAGNGLLALAAAAAAVLPWWFAFLVLTIAAERLEMTRLMRRRRGAAGALHACLAVLLLGAAASALAPRLGGLLYGLALLALALWLITHDIARRTLFAQGLSRYMALCLLLGYAWLAVAGLAWAATALGHPLRDLALHALGLGFVFSMMLGHAPVILPAVARVKLLFSGFFYLPLALLHATLILRLGFGGSDPALLRAGAAGNAAAIAWFAATVAGSVLAWRWRSQAGATRARAGAPPG